MRRISCIAVVLSALLPATSKAQSTGQIECPRAGGYVYLYSSMITLDVRTTLQCGQEVQITGRYDGYFGVRTAKGEIGYVPLDSLLLIKDSPGAATGPAAAPKPARERTPYDDAQPLLGPAAAGPVGPDFILKNGTTVHLKVGKSISSATAHVGDTVALEAAEDVVVDGLLVIAKGAAASGTVTDAEPKKKLGHGGKVGVVVNSVLLSDSEKVAIRGYEATNAANATTGAMIPLMSGKDVELGKGTEVIAWVDGDIHLKREAFAPAVAATPKNATATANAEKSLPQSKH